MRTVSEPTQLKHRTQTDARKVFVPGEEVPEEWLLPEDTTPEESPLGGGDGDGDDDEDEEDDEEPATGGLGTSESGPLDLDVVTASVASIVEAVNGLPEAERPAAASWVLAKETARPEPRKTLVTAMQGLL